MKTIQFNLRSGLAAGSLKAVLALGIAAVVCTMGNPAQADFIVNEMDGNARLYNSAGTPAGTFATGLATPIAYET